MRFNAIIIWLRLKSIETPDSESNFFHHRMSALKLRVKNKIIKDRKLKGKLKREKKTEIFYEIVGIADDGFRCNQFLIIKIYFVIFWCIRFANFYFYL